MPYINLQTTAKVSEEKELELKSAFGKAVETVPGKSERWLMFSVEDGRRMWFAGNCDSDCAIVSVSVYGGISDSVSDKLTGEICDILEESLGLSASRIYVRYSEHTKWGFNGSNF